MTPRCTACSSVLTAVMALSVFLSEPSFSAGAEGADEFAGRTFANAEQLMKEGKTEQALKDFAQVAAAYPESGLADDALYRIGHHYYPANDIESVGTAGRDATGKARDLFLKIKTAYPRGDRAPQALIKLGLIALDPDGPEQNSDEAYAAFTGVVNIYPASESVGDGLFGAGFVDFSAGRYDRAMPWFERVAEEFPSLPVAPSARYHLGLALMRMGSWIRAAEELQALRNEWPAGKFAGMALDLVTQIHRMRLAPATGAGPLFGHDSTYAPILGTEFGRGGIEMAADASSVLHLLDTRSGAIRRLNHLGQPASAGPDSGPVVGASAIAVDARGEEIVALGDRIRAGGETIAPMRSEGGKLQAIEGISAAVRIGPRSIAFLDGDASEVLVYAGNPAQPGVLYADPGKRVRLAGLARGPEGRLYTIDRRGKRILEISRSGQSRDVPLDTQAKAALLDPVAIAVNDLGDLFVLDRRTDAVLVVTTEGRTLQILQSAQGTTAEFSEPRSLCVGPRSEIYIYDDRRRTVLRFW